MIFSGWRFLPENTKSFVKHAVQNAYNSFTYGEIMWTDWDMWWTDEANSVKSGVLRGISGGPVYLSDKLGRTVADKVFPLITSDGKILRFEKPGVPSDDILLKDIIKEHKVLKIINSYKDMGGIAVFKTYEGSENKDMVISLDDNKYLEKGPYIAYEYFNGTYEVIDKKSSAKFDFDVSEVLAVFISPIRNGFAVIGLKDKYFPCTTIDNWSVNVNAMQCTTKSGGSFIFYSEKKL